MGGVFGDVPDQVEPQGLFDEYDEDADDRRDAAIEDAIDREAERRWEKQERELDAILARLAERRKR
jgi:hypothetical protein